MCIYIYIEREREGERCGLCWHDARVTPESFLQARQGLAAALRSIRVLRVRRLRFVDSNFWEIPYGPRNSTP